MSSDRALIRNLLDQVKAEGRSTLNPNENRTLCAAYGIPVPREGIAHSPAELSRLVNEIGPPLVMKIVSSDILHKTEAGGVIVGVKSSAEAHRGTRRFCAMPAPIELMRNSMVYSCSRC